MKTFLLLLPLTGLALVASAGEPVKTDTITSAGMTLAATNAEAAATNTPPATTTGTLTATEQADNERVAERIVRTDAISVKPLRPTTEKAAQLFNPFAPIEEQPDTRWLSRAPWGGASEIVAKPTEPAEIQHEPHFGVTIASR